MKILIHNFAPMAELLLYTSIYEYSAETIINSLNETKDDDSVDLRVNSVGGSVFSGWGIAAKISEVGNVNMKIDGLAASMAAALIPFAKSVEALDVSRIMIHRADMWNPSEEDKKQLDSINKDLRAKLTKKIDEAKLKELKGVSFKDIFDAEERIDVWLTAKEAKAIGLIDKVVKLSPNEAKAYDSRLMSIAATLDKKPESNQNQNQNKSTMTKEELKAKHPEVYASIVNDGIAQEKDRVGAWMTFVKADAEAVVKGIKEGATLSATAMAELSLKAMSAATLEKIEAKAPGAVVTDEDKSKGNSSPEKANLEAFTKEIESKLNVKLA